MASEEGDELSLEFTPTWVVAVVCFIIIFISLLVERGLHYVGTYLEKNQKPLFEALQKLKEELMLLGFISLMLTALQGPISKICISEKYVRDMLPCSIKEKEPVGRLRRFLSEAATSQSAYCASKHKVPFLSIEGLHQLHIFIFVLAVVHVIFSVVTVVFGEARIRQWKHWEDATKENYDTDQALEAAENHVPEYPFILNHFVGFGRKSAILRWMLSFIKQFYGAFTKDDYLTLRNGFIMNQCPGNPKYNFHEYVIRALEDDFKQVVGISWYLWVFVIIFLLLNVNGWNTYFWIAFIPFILLLALGTKLEHVISELAHQVAKGLEDLKGEVAVKPSDEHFWFSQPGITLLLIHFILFQNAFEIAFFFWIWMLYGFDSCIMGQVRYTVPRLVIGVIIQVLCSYSTLPLYAIVTQMGSHFKISIFNKHVQAGLLEWQEKAKKKKGLMVQQLAPDGSATATV